MNVVNVEYRLARTASAPAAVEACRCALRWVIQHAKEYGIDVNRLVVSGGSAGGHLALTTGMLPASAGLDRQCPGPDNLKVAAIVNWFGISDVNELLDGPNMKAYAVAWLGSALAFYRHRQACVAAHLRSARRSSDPDDSRRRRSDRPLHPIRPPAQSARRRRRAERADDDGGRQAWVRRLHTNSPRSSVREDPRVPRAAARPRGAEGAGHRAGAEMTRGMRP